MKHPFWASSALAAAALVLLVLAVPAAGALRTGTGVGDPDDTLGRLDIRSVSAVRTRIGGARGVSYRLNTFSPWTGRMLRGNEVDVLIDTNEDGATDFTGTIQGVGRAGRDLVMWMHSEADGWIEMSFVRHPHGTTVAFFVPDKSKLGWNVRTEFWVSFTSRFSRSKGVCTVPCVDRAPDSGWITVQASS